VKGGGSLYLTGERPCCEQLNESDQEIARTVLRNKAIVVGHQGDFVREGEPHRFNPKAADGIATTPNTLGEFPATNPGGIAGIGDVNGRNVLANNEGTALAGVFDESDMTNGRGRLVIYMDINWLTHGQPNPTRMAVIENIADFLEKTPTRLPPRSPEYVALGDSYASGVGSFSYLPGTTGDKGCYQATNGYVEQIASETKLSLGFEACSGSEINEVWEPNKKRDAQLVAPGLDTSLITLSIGGNDVGFSSVIQSCVNGIDSNGGSAGCAERDAPAAVTALAWLEQGRAPGKYVHPGGRGASTNWTRQPSLQELYEAIAVQAPYAKLVVVGYPLLLESGQPVVKDCQIGTVAGLDKLSLKAPDIEWINKETNTVDEVIEWAVIGARRSTGADIVFADPRVRFTGHGVCDVEQNFINPYLSRAKFWTDKTESFHPTAEGQDVIDEVVDAARENPAEGP
jgi:hypothetical protein